MAAGGAFVFFFVSVFAVAPSHAREDLEKVLIADPYVELHTGPGRGYPVFHVVERGLTIQLIKRRTDWYKVRTEQGVEGWVARRQIERTLTAAGVPRTVRDIVFEDYLERRFEVSLGGGRFEDDPILNTRLGYRLSDNLSVELSYGLIPGDFSSTTLIYGSIASMPFPDWWLSPIFTLGAGRFRNEPKATLVSNPDTKADLANVGIGVRTYIGRRFFARADYKLHVILLEDQRNEEFKELSVGLGFFF